MKPTETSLDGMMDIDRLAQMLDFHSVVSNTEALADWLMAQLRPHATRIEQDRLGAIYAWRGESPQVGFFCHLDSVGFMVEEIHEAHVQVVPLGKPATPHYTPIVIQSDTGMVNGTLLVQGADDERTLRVDLWDEAVAAQLQVGDLAAFAPNFRQEAGRIHSRWLDNKLGIWVALEAWLGSDEALFVAMVREEQAPHDAGAVALRLPDLALALVVDITYAASPEGPYMVAQGNGPSLTLRDAMVYDRRWLSAIRRVAERHQIPLQPEITLVGGSDATMLSMFGLPALFIGIPTRYAHSPAEMAHLSDCEAAVALLTATATAFQTGVI